MKLKRIFALVLAFAALALSLTACSSAKTEAGTATVKLGVVGGIYEDLWKPAQEALKAEGIDLQIVQFSDYVTPNNALDSGDIDLNAFQHQIYLDNEIAQYNYEIETVGYTFIIPLNLYSHKVSSVDEIQDGDTVAIPDDVTNGGRALKLLEAAGLFTLNPDKGYVPNKTDITHFNKKVQIVEAESGMLANLLLDVTAAVINGGNAFTAKLDPYADSIFSENLDPKTNPYFGQLVNVIVAREADKDNPVYKKVVAAYQTQDVAQTLKDAYKGAYVPVWPGAADYKLK